jgi:hypothetical protein
LNQNKDDDKLSVEVAGFVVEGWFVIKKNLGGGGYGVCCREKWWKKNEEGRAEGRSSGHKLNIRDGFTDEFNQRV